MAEEVLWHREDHTAAKHRLLRAYLDAWVPVMGFQALKAPMRIGEPRVLLVDGFAGPGRYEGGQPGSPLIMIDAITSHAQAAKLTDVRYILVFIEQDKGRAEHLEGELANLTLPANVTVHVEHGKFEDTFSELVDVDQGKVLVPTFAFVDPFGYSEAPMSLTGRLLDFPRSEALFFLPLTQIARFVGAKNAPEQALYSLFGTDRWREAIPLTGRARRDFLVGLFEEQLRAQGQVQHAKSFELRTADGNDYRLVFATGHDKGLDLIKDAMWSVDPVEGQRYIARTSTGQEVLFTTDRDAVDTEALLDELHTTFASDWFTIEQAQGVTRRSVFKQGHLKNKTLKPAEDAGLLEVDRSGGRRQFVAGVRMRFTSGDQR